MFNKVKLVSIGNLWFATDFVVFCCSSHCCVRNSKSMRNWTRGKVFCHVTRLVWSKRIATFLRLIERKKSTAKEKPTRVIILRKETTVLSCSKFLPNFRYIKKGTANVVGGTELGHFCVDYNCNRVTHEFVATQTIQRKRNAHQGNPKTLTQIHVFFNNKLLKNNKMKSRERE